MLTKPPHEILKREGKGTKETSRRVAFVIWGEAGSFPTYFKGPLAKTDSHNLVLIRHSSIAGAKNENTLLLALSSGSFTTSI